MGDQVVSGADKLGQCVRNLLIKKLCFQDSAPSIYRLLKDCSVIPVSAAAGYHAANKSKARHLHAMWHVNQNFRDVHIAQIHPALSSLLQEYQQQSH